MRELYKYITEVKLKNCKIEVKWKNGSFGLFEYCTACTKLYNEKNFEENLNKILKIIFVSSVTRLLKEMSCHY